MDRTPKTPKLCRHARGYGVVRLNGHDHYSAGMKWPEGQPPPPEILAWYQVLINEWKAAGRHLVPGKRCTIAQLVEAFLKYAAQYYQGSFEPRDFRLSLAPLAALFGQLQAADFTPKKLKAVRQGMIDAGLARKVINQRIRRIKAVFAWAAEQELAPGAVHQNLRCVKGLKKGRTTAKETKRIRPAPMQNVRAVQAASLPAIQAMISLQLLTGMRPGEVCRLSPGQIERRKRVWIYRPDQHKTDHLGHTREILLSCGPGLITVSKRPPSSRPRAVPWWVG